MTFIQPSPQDACVGKKDAFGGKLLTGTKDSQNGLGRSSGPWEWRGELSTGSAAPTEMQLCDKQAATQRGSKPSQKEIQEGHKKLERQKAGREMKGAARAREGAGSRSPMLAHCWSHTSCSCQGMAQAGCTAPAAIPLSLQNKC